MTLSLTGTMTESQSAMTESHTRYDRESVEDSIKKQEDTLTKKPRKPRSPKQVFNDLIHNAVATVTLCPSSSFNGLVTSALKAENPDKDAEWIAAEVRRRFGVGGLWYSVDFRGKKNQRPTPNQIISEWNRVLDFSENGSKIPTVKHAEDW
jgi:hypothetical protein